MPQTAQAGAAPPTPIVVETLADSGELPPPPQTGKVSTNSLVIDGACSLREAIENANNDDQFWTDCETGNPGLDLIVFDAAIPANSTIVVAGGAFGIVDDLDIDGTLPAGGTITLDAADASRIFTITDTDASSNFSVTLRDMTLTNGDTTSESFTEGGAIRAEENLTLDTVTVTNSDAVFSGSGGGLFHVGVDGSSPNLTILSSTFTGNTADCCGGAISSFYAGDVSISQSFIGTVTPGEGNTAITGGGIAIAGAFSVLIDETDISGNSVAGLGAVGGGLYLYAISGTIDIEQSTISGNSAEANGGGLAGRYVGALEIRDSTVSGNSAGLLGGGAAFYVGSTVNVLRTRVIGNVADDGVESGDGAGIAAGYLSLTITDSEISGNDALDDGGGIDLYESGATILNSTIANNTAGDIGGGIRASYGAGVSLTLTTVAGNSAVTSGGNGYFYSTPVYLENSIVSGGTAPTDPDIFSAYDIDADYTLIGVAPNATVNGTNNEIGTLVMPADPQLGPLQINGGTTQTMKPAGASPVVNAGDPAFTPPPNFDQRQTPFARVVNSAVDMGALELQAGTLALSSATYNVAENVVGGTVTITVNRTGGSEGSASVDYAITSGSATSGTDFGPASGTGTLNWADGDSAPKSFTVPITDDNVFEGDETFNVTLSNPVNDALGLAAAVVTILDNEVQPTLSILDVTQLEGTGGTTNFVFDVNLSGPTTQTVTVDFGTLAVSATAGGTDFTTNSGTLTFNPLDTNEQITISINPDALDETNETFDVNLSNPNANATILDGTAVGTITDDDGPPALNIGDVTQAEGNAGNTNFNFNVTLAPASGQQVTVDYTVTGVSATDGSDFTATSGTLTFVIGDTTETISVVVAGDTTVEGNETFNVTLSNPSFATVGDGTGLGTITNDDVAPVADLTVSKAVVGSGPFVVGDNVTFTITVNNAGPDSATNATVTDILPAGTSFVSAVAAPGSCTGTTTVTCNVGTLANGGSATITLTVQTTMAGTITNTATGASDAGDPTPASGSAQFNVSAPAVGDAIPTLSEWMLIALASALAAAAALKLKH